jgi:hypothetical protein
MRMFWQAQCVVAESLSLGRNACPRSQETKIPIAAAEARLGNPPNLALGECLLKLAFVAIIKEMKRPASLVVVLVGECNGETLAGSGLHAESTQCTVGINLLNDHNGNVHSGSS